MGIRGWLQHRLNPQHVRCRLIDCGMSKWRANRWARRYENWFYRRVLG